MFDQLTRNSKTLSHPSTQLRVPKFTVIVKRARNIKTLSKAPFDVDQGARVYSFSGLITEPRLSVNRYINNAAFDHPANITTDIGDVNFFYFITIYSFYNCIT